MQDENSLIKERLKKLSEIKAKGINPYPYSYARKDFAAELQEKFAKLKNEEHAKQKACVAGRLKILRRMGKATFADLHDSSGKVQIYFKEDDIGNEKYSLLRLLDAGDFIGVEGTVFRTKTGEITVNAQSFTMLSKAVRPLPEKFHGLKDDELRQRKRYLDLIMNPEVRQTFLKRTRIVQLVRQFLDSRGFTEVETPALQPIYGGTNARPFETHLNVLSMKVYLRVAPELYLKRLVIGGFEKVYEICKNFRNEGVDLMHNPEFTMIEWYEAYADYEKMMDTAEELYKFIAKELNNSLKLEFRGRKIDLSGKWERIAMTDIIRQKLGIDVLKMSQQELLDYANKNRAEFRGEPLKGVLIFAVFEKLVADKLDGPVWIIDYPKEVSPLAKPHRSKEGFVERFECYVSGKEIGDGWSEIIDPVDQRQRFEGEQRALRAGNPEAHPMDEDFIEALEYGMPVLGGIGIGIDRLVMFFTNQESIREVIFFPFMRKR